MKSAARPASRRRRGPRRDRPARPVRLRRLVAAISISTARSLSSLSATRSRAATPSSRSARPQDPVLLAARGDPRALPLGRALDCHRRHARQDHDDLAGRLGADRTAALDPSVLVGGIARNFGEHGSSYRMGQGRDFVIEGDEYDSAFFDKTAKFLKYLPDIAVDQQRRVRSRRHLRRFRRGDAGVPPARQPGAAHAGCCCSAPTARRRARWRSGAVSRVETFGTAPRRRLAGARSRTGRRDRPASRSGAAGRRSAHSRCRWSARTTSATRSAAIAVATEVGIGAERIARGPAAVRRRQAAARGRRHRRRRHGVRRLRAPSDGGGRNARRPARVASRRAHLGGVRAALRVVVPARVPGRLRAARSRAPTRSLLAPVFRSTLPEAERLSVPQLVRDLARRAASRRATPDRIDDIVDRHRRRASAGRLVVLMSNGGFGGIHQKLLRALGVRRWSDDQSHADEPRRSASCRRRLGAGRRVRGAHRRGGQRARRSRSAEAIEAASACRRARRRADVPIGRGLFRSAAHRHRRGCHERLERDGGGRALGGRRLQPQADSGSGVLRRRVGRISPPSPAFAGIDRSEVVALHAGADLPRLHARLRAGICVHGHRRPRIAVPRRSTPRVRVPVRSVGIAGGQTGIYPAETPGGWQLIGRTPLKPFDLARGRAVPAEAGRCGPVLSRSIADRSCPAHGDGRDARGGLSCMSSSRDC